MRKRRLEENLQLANGHIAHEWLNQDLDCDFIVFGKTFCSASEREARGSVESLLS